MALSDSTDDILAKYRKKPSVSSDGAEITRLNGAISQVYLNEPAGNEPEFSAFNDAKKKLRLVLSNADSSVPLMVRDE